MNIFDLNNFPTDSHEDDELPNSNQEGLAEEDFSNPSQEEFPFDLNIPLVEEEEFANQSMVGIVVNETTGEGNRKRRFLSNDERKMIYGALLIRSVNGKLKRNTTKEVASMFYVPLQSVQRIWSRAKKTPIGSVVDMSGKQPKNCGRKRVEFNLDRIRDVPLHRRSALRSLSQALNMSLSTLHSRLKEGCFRRHSNAIKPLLKEDNKMARLRFCISMLDRNSLPHQPKFASMYNTVHIDEKWFYLTKKSKKYYLLPSEDDPLRSCQSKNFIPKVMFLAALARPSFDQEGNEIFSGKIGIFPFVAVQSALRSSINREAGTMETKAMTSVTKDIIRSFLVEKVIPTIQAKWPREDARTTIFIQQDNARTHVDPNDEELRRAATQNGFDIRLCCQPPNSPDMNVLDLGFFNAIQSLQDKECARTVDELLAVVQRSFEDYPAHLINRVFLSLQLCMRETMKNQGGNKYHIPHLHKQRLERDGNLLTQISCDQALVESVMEILQ